ncbi:MAG: choice-of-anchor Q domain-containing protein [bacterium]
MLKKIVIKLNTFLILIIIHSTTVLACYLPFQDGFEQASPSSCLPHRPTAGIDLQQCKIPVVPNTAGWVYVCDCQSGQNVQADSSCTPGDNLTGDGTALNPWRTLTIDIDTNNDQIPDTTVPGPAMNAFNSGNGKIAFCRGGVWIENPLSGEIPLNLDNPVCSAQSPCIWADYGSTELPSPTIEIQSDSGFVTNFSNTNRSGFEFRNLRFTYAGSGIPAAFTLIYDMSNAIFSCLEIDQFAIAFNLNNLGRIQNNIFVQDSYIHDNTDQGWLGGCDNCGLARNLLVNNGMRPDCGFFCHSTYFGNNANNMFLANNLIKVDNRCHGTIVNAHGGTMNGTRIQNNIIESTSSLNSDNGGCWGIGVDNSSSDFEINSNAVISGNFIKNVGSTIIGIASCDHCLIENNVIIQSNIGADAIAVPTFLGGGNNGINSDTTIRNNTIFYDDMAAGIGIRLGSEGSGYFIENNIIYYNKNMGTGIHIGTAEANIAAVSHNLVFGGHFDSGTTGLDSFPLSIDPLFKNMPDDLRLQPFSPAINSASTNYPSVDILNTPRSDGLADRGAYEAPQN